MAVDRFDVVIENPGAFVECRRVGGEGVNMLVWINRDRNFALDACFVHHSSFAAIEVGSSFEASGFNELHRGLLDVIDSIAFPDDGVIICVGS
ncbi:hypothetical protein LQ50_22365 [Halalkalibacter okhensis]|uniref:Uncharacterized protein n=1 Tax=Halalkalibacter okhensis TaxID=333138 RepID=A0A0B0IBP2_9BACI|nr:hypothetical protein LQ50_22365 [Halalkalibacter okhensis]